MKKLAIGFVFFTAFTMASSTQAEECRIAWDYGEFGSGGYDWYPSPKYKKDLQDLVDYENLFKGDNSVFLECRELPSKPEELLHPASVAPA